MIRKGWLATSGLAACMVWSGHVAAQTPASPPQDAASAPSDVADVVVTGSRLASTLLNSPSPVIAITSRQLEQTGTDNLERALIQIPAVGVGLSDTNTENFYALAGLNLVDLRHLGYARTLVLVNGRRQVAGDIFSNAVDLNSIPAPLVDRVEVVTGGTSAVYGADAVSGTVNIILKDRYEGLDARIRGGITSAGDGASYGVSLLGGQNFADKRGNITATFLYDQTDGVKARDRDYAHTGLATIVNPAYIGAGAGLPPLTITRQDVRYYGANQAGLIDLGSAGVFVPTSDGTGIRPFNFGAIGNSAGRTIGGDAGTFSIYDNLSLPLERFSGSLNATYALTPHAELFFEARITDTQTSTRWQPTADFQYGSPFIATSNPYVPAQLRAGLTAAGAPGFYFARVYDDFGLRGADDDRLTQQYTGGIRGTLLDKYKYEVFAGYGRTQLDTHLVGGRDQDRFLDSINVTLINGAPACASATARANGCAPLNVFAPSTTQAGIAYSQAQDDYSATNQLGMVGGNISGDLFTLPAGAVSGVIGTEFRENTAETSPSAATQLGRNQLLFEKPQSGDIDVKEVFSELRVPLLKNLPLIHELTFQGAVRYSDYSTNGGHVSWNVGGVWSPVESVRFRVMQSRSVRAPNVNELYASTSQTFLNLNDPCSRENLTTTANRVANCAALGIPTGFVQSAGSKATFVGGNPNLDVETADTSTVGVTVAPHFIKGLSFTVDYFDVNIAGAIGSIPAQTLLDNCVSLPVAVASNPACAAVVRDSSSRQISAVYGLNLNIGRFLTRGIDFTANYAFEPRAIWERLPGRVELNVTGTHLDSLRQFTNASDPRTQIQFEGFRGFPKWQVLSTATYSVDRLAVTWRLRFLDSTSVAASQLIVSPIAPNTYDLPNTGTRTYNDLSISYDITRSTNLRLNVDNIFNLNPPARGFNIYQGLGTNGLGGGSIYPNLGTSFSFVLQHKFR